MDRFCVVEKRAKGHHAGAKARNDIADILMGNGWKPVFVHSWKNNSFGEKAKMLLTTSPDWKRVCRLVPGGAELIFQYPLATFPRTRRQALPYLQKMKKNGVRIIALLHDLDSLRGVSCKLEQEFLHTADVLIAHNRDMVAYLKEQGYGEKKIISLEIFDYLLSEKQAGFLMEKAFGGTVIIAGNLAPEKSAYLYQLGQLKGEVRFSLYGPNYQAGNESERVSYCGSYPPEMLPEKLEGNFGLVWDGESLDTCSGGYGEYLRYNNPHKASLYLACGIPVIIWSKAALAKFVLESGSGIAVDSLREIPEAISNLGEEGYRRLQKNARAIADELRKGNMTLAALKQI